MSIERTAQTTETFSLETFSPHAEANRLLDEIPASPPEDYTPEGFVQAKISALHPDAQWPTYVALQNIYDNYRKAETLAYQSGTLNTFLSPPEAEVASYAFNFPARIDRDFTPEEATLWTALSDSRRTYKDYSDFRAMKHNLDSRLTFMDVLDSEWLRVQKESLSRDVTESFSPEVISAQWTQLQESLANERDFEERAQQHANAQVKVQPWSPSADPRYTGANELTETDQQYKAILDRQTGERIVSTEVLKQHVDTVRANDPIDTAEILLETVLSEANKASVLEIQEQFRTNRSLVSEATYIDSYKDPIFHALTAFVKEKGSDWNKQLQGFDDQLISRLQKILIGDYSRLPAQTQRVLANPEHTNSGKWDVQAAFDMKRSSILTGYVQDVAIALLMANNSSQP